LGNDGNMPGEALLPRPRWPDVAIGGSLALLTAVLWWQNNEQVGLAAVASLGLQLAQVVPLIWLRAHPWPVLIVVAAAQFCAALIESGTVRQGPVFVAASVYGVACHTSLRGSLLALGTGALFTVAPLVVKVLIGAEAMDPVAPVLLFAVVAVAWLLGRGHRRIAADAARLRQLTEQLSAERELRERQAVHAERARIAADLHDIVAHHVSAIAVQANAAADQHMHPGAPDRPGGVDNAAAKIAAAADTALVEMRRMLKLLAVPTEEGQERATSGEPSLSHLDQLADVARSAGCEVSVHVREEVLAAPASVQVCAYRIVQEAITNIVKHAGPVRVRIDLRDVRGSLMLAVENGPARPVVLASDRRQRPAISGAGRGLIGMRERVAVFGGTIHAGPDRGSGWRVAVTLPTGNL
jgi:signal transduction histidine kinase